MEFEQRIGQFNPTKPMDQLVIEVNKVFHSFEAASYDTNHPEVHQQLPEIWKSMTDILLNERKEADYYVLDFGCGTGFEASQFIRNIPNARIKRLVFFDLSPEMLAEAKKKFSQTEFECIFTNDKESLPNDGPYNVLLTNSLLHHLPAPLATIAEIEPSLAADCIWCAGHEPSSRFYANEHCVNLLQEYRKGRILKQMINPLALWKKFKSCIGIDNGLHRNTADEAFRKGLFEIRPSSAIIGLLVDYHVAHTKDEADSGRGFCYKRLADQMTNRWNLIWHDTYSFMGYYYEGSLPNKWQKRTEPLKAEYPDDGANFSAVWKRTV